MSAFARAHGNFDCRQNKLVSPCVPEMRTRPDVHGILVVDKPSGPTSHDVVAQARKLYGTPRVGHTGTLDPMATGVLVLLFGEATKVSAALGSADKVYRARVIFGAATDTDDAWGNPIDIAPPNPNLLDIDRLNCALDRERERTLQTPPRSAQSRSTVSVNITQLEGEMKLSGSLVLSKSMICAQSESARAFWNSKCIPPKGTTYAHWRATWVLLCSVLRIWAHCAEFEVAPST